jgi:hypothetical protein
MKKIRTLVSVATLAVFISAAAGVSYGLMPCTKSMTIYLLGELCDKSLEACDRLRELVRAGSDPNDRRAIDEFVHGDRESIFYQTQAEHQ